MKGFGRVAALLSLTTIVACSAPSEEPTPDTDVVVIAEDVGGVDLAEQEPDVAQEEPLAEVPKPMLLDATPLVDLNDDPRIVEYELEAKVAPITLEDGLTLDMYTYNGSVPGPLLQANVGDEVIVHFTNNLPEPTTVHWHGLRISDAMDGNPRIQSPVQPGETFTYSFVVPDAGTYWYHPHMRTNEQIEKGLSAPLVVHEPLEEQPAVDAERMLVLDDILLDGEEFAPFLKHHMEVMHGRFGNVLLTNGSSQTVTMQARQGEVERWRLVNAANARTMVVAIAGAKVRVVGTDGGRVTPFEADRLLLPVGRRYDLEVRYEDTGTVELQQIVLTRNSAGDIVERPYAVATVDVAESADAPTTVGWVPAAAIPVRSINREETIILDAVDGARGIEWRINGKSHNHEPLFTFQKGDTVRLVLQNDLGPEHPFHLHGQFFLDASGNDPGLLDTILVPGLSRVTLTAFMDNPGDWMMHCHIAEHAELGMMSAIRVAE